MSICSIEKCGKKSHGKGLCSKHYNRFRATGITSTERERLMMSIPKNCIALTDGKYAIVDEDMFDYLNQWTWHITAQGYAGRNVSQKDGGGIVLMHRQLLGSKKGESSDHKNHIRLDNRRENLRKCTVGENNRNMSMMASNTSGYIGVSRTLGKWQAYVNHNGKKCSAGYFRRKMDAAFARDKLAKKLHGAFAALNFPVPI